MSSPFLKSLGGILHGIPLHIFSNTLMHLQTTTKKKIRGKRTKGLFFQTALGNKISLYQKHSKLTFIGSKEISAASLRPTKFEGKRRRRKTDDDDDVHVCMYMYIQAEVKNYGDTVFLRADPG